MGELAGTDNPERNRVFRSSTRVVPGECCVRVGELSRCQRVSVGKIDQLEFRPIKSQEDTEREEAIDMMVHTTSGGKSQMCRDHAELLYDSGYHNGPKVKEFSDEEIEVFFREGIYSPHYKIDAAKWARDYMLGKTA